MQKIWRIEERDANGELLNESCYFANLEEARQFAEVRFGHRNYRIVADWLKQSSSNFTFVNIK